jgi:penicillin-binding protein 2
MPRPRTPRAAFRRRLALLMILFLAASAAMAAQMVRLGVVQADTALAEAERRLYRQRWVPTVRGRILDRHGRVLAQNRPTYEVAIDFRVLSGQWSRDRAAEHARRVHAAAWPMLTAQQREAVVARFLPLYEAHVRTMERRVQGVLGVEAEAYEERKARILAQVEQTASAVARARMERFRREQVERGRWLTPEIYAVLEERATAPIAAEREPHVVGDASDEVAFDLIRLLDAVARVGPPEADRAVEEEAPGARSATVPLLPGLEVRRSEDRQYPYDRARVTVPRDTLPGPVRDAEPLALELEGVAAHVVGWMGSRALATDVERRAEALASDPGLAARALIATREGRAPVDRGRYLPGDPAPRAGVEWSHEATLRGLRGLRTERLDIARAERIEPEPGQDVRLTLDIHLQARVQALLDPRVGLTKVQPYHGVDLPMPVGTELAGAAVVVDVDSGEVLALVTSPSFSRRAMREDPASLFEDAVGAPLVNRAIGKPYPPGSVLKALTLCGAVTFGNHRLGERIACRGHLLPDNDQVLRCWIYRPVYGFSNHTARFGGRDPDAVEALTTSCNIFFYTLGRRMGPRRMADTLEIFGVGEPFGLGVGMEFPGSIGPMGEGGGRGALTEFDATIMGIGQGPVAWTPLHAADAYATLARMGVTIRPRVIDDGSGPHVRETSLDRRAIAAALEGLEGVVNNADHGTAYRLRLETGEERVFNTPGIRVWGKSSTAQAPPVFGPDPSRDGDGNPIPVRSGDHAWFTALAGREGDRPRYSISVIVEYGGSGGRVAGPIVNQIVRALVDEGYL